MVRLLAMVEYIEGPAIFVVSDQGACLIDRENVTRYVIARSFKFSVVFSKSLSEDYHFQRIDPAI